MSPRFLLTLAVAASLLACGNARDVASKESATDCTRCHGGVDDKSGAPPTDLHGGRDTTAVGVGAHTSHVRDGRLDCVFCHPKPDARSAHPDGRLTVTGYTGTDPAWKAAEQDPGFTETTATCATAYCHGAFPGGNTTNAPVWNEVGQGQAACGTCHALPPPPPHPALAPGVATTACALCHSATIAPDGSLRAGGAHVNAAVDVDPGGRHPDGWYDAQSPTGGAHGLAAAQGAAPCLECHAAREPATVAAVTCASCHEQAGQDWTLTCTGCHGSAANAAPPRDTLGRTSTAFASVGAHQAHVTAPHGLSAPLDCSYCHLKPANVFDPAHLDGAVTVTGYTGSQDGLGSVVGDPGWDGASATCATAYCHGAFTGGNATNAPIWTAVGQGQATCGTCHGLPPPPPHPAVPPDLTICAGCHAETVDPSGRLIPPSQGGKHLDGKAEATGHTAEWLDPTSTGFHAFSADANIQQCTICHGTDLSGGAVYIGCGRCHDGNLPAGVTTWAQNCVMCHGGTDNPTGAPPAATWGHAGDPNRGGGTADPVRVGAHSAHVTAGPFGGPFDCSVCHVKPDSALAAGHVDQPTATVTFSGVAVADGATPAPWDRTAATCSAVYCHGATLGAGGTHTTPSWTGGSGEAFCGSCHAAPPPPPHPAIPSDPALCATCHPGTVAPSGAIIPASQGGLHVNGSIEFQNAHDPSWMDTSSDKFHAFYADRGLAACQQCHGQDLSGGGVGVACADCHSAGGQASSADFSTCTGCHGATDNTTGAPPRATWGNTDPVAVGAHTAHVTGTGHDGSRALPMSLPFDCVACHVKPADMFSAGHIDDLVTVTAYNGTGPLAALATDPGFSAPTSATATCATAYCHGATIPGGSDKTPLWTKLDGTQAACGTCHGMPPDDGPQVNTNYKAHRYHVGYWSMSCDNCHLGDAWGGTGNLGNAVDPAKHVNGVRDVNGLDYCNTPRTTIVGWDCTGCHATRYVCP